MKTNAVHRISIALALLAAEIFLTNCSQALYLAKKNICLNPPRTARRVETFIHECQEDVKNKLISEAYQMIKEEVYKEYRHLDADDDNMQFMNYDPATVSYSSNHQSTGPGSDSIQTAFSAPSQATQNDFRLPTTFETYQDERSRRRVTMDLMHRVRRITYDSPNNIYNPTLVPFEDKRIAGCLLHCVYAKNNAIDNLGWPTLDGLVDFYSEGVNEHGFFMASLRSVNLCLRAVTIKYRVNRRKLPERGESCDLAFDVFDCISDQITGYCLHQYK